MLDRGLRAPNALGKVRRLMAVVLTFLAVAGTAVVVTLLAGPPCSPVTVSPARISLAIESGVVPGKPYCIRKAVPWMRVCARRCRAVPVSGSSVSPAP
jgi:hypothetical protein